MSDAETLSLLRQTHGPCLEQTLISHGSGCQQAVAKQIEMLKTSYEAKAIHWHTCPPGTASATLFLRRRQ